MKEELNPQVGDVWESSYQNLVNAREEIKRLKEALNKIKAEESKTNRRFINALTNSGDYWQVVLFEGEGENAKFLDGWEEL